MKQKDIKVLTYAICDADTGMVLSQGKREYDLRFRVQRDQLHKLLDDYLDQIRESSDNYFAFELVSVHPYVEQYLPF